MTFKTEDLIYAAAVIDTDGCIFVTRRARSGPDSYYAEVQVGMTKKPIIDWFYQTFGGHMNTGVVKNQYALVSRWGLKCRQANKFVSLILPYLKLKNKQAELALQLQATFPVARSTKTPSEEILNLRKSIWSQMRVLNARGLKRMDCINPDARHYYSHVKPFNRVKASIESESRKEI